MSKYYDTLIYFIHVDMELFENCTDLQHVIERARNLTNEYLADSSGRITEDVGDVDEAILDLRKYVSDNWKDIQEFFGDV